jgi:hypothetical protein
LRARNPCIYAWGGKRALLLSIRVPVGTAQCCAVLGIYALHDARQRLNADGPFITIEVPDGRGGRQQQVIHETWLVRRDEACEDLGEIELTVRRLYKGDDQ